MKIISKDDILNDADFYIQEIIDGKIFVYPTDTVYGIGCNARNHDAVIKLRIAKNTEKPWPVIAPNREWIDANLRVDDCARSWLKKFPGKFTIILEIKNEFLVDSSVAQKTLGVRIPNHWFSKIIEKSWIPFVTTSVSVSKSPYCTSVHDIPDELKSVIDYAIDDGVINNKPSRVVEIIKNKEKILRD